MVYNQKVAGSNPARNFGSSCGNLSLYFFRHPKSIITCIFNSTFECSHWTARNLLLSFLIIIRFSFNWGCYCSSIGFYMCHIWYSIDCYIFVCATLSSSSSPSQFLSTSFLQHSPCSLLLMRHFPQWLLASTENLNISSSGFSDFLSLVLFSLLYFQLPVNLI